MVFSTSCGGAGGLRLIRARKKARGLGWWERREKQVLRLASLVQDDSMFGIRMGEGQGSREDARGGVPVAGLEGHWSRSAVYLVHRERVSGRRRADEGRTVRRASC